MAETHGSVLIAEIGSLITKVTLVDLVDGESRMIGHAETQSSIEPPYQNALYAVLEASAQLAEMTGRQLLREGQLIMPQGKDHDGVDQVVVVTSAAGAMSLVITAIAADLSARSARHAICSTYTTLLQTVTLDDAAGEAIIGGSGLSWIERQVQALLNLRPDTVLIAGGLEHGAIDALNRLAHIVSLTAVSTTIDQNGQQHQNIQARPVIYAGNSAAREQVIEALSDRAEIFVVENLRPTLEEERLQPTRQELSRLYERQILPRLPGIAGLRRMSRAPIRTVCDVTGLIARFGAERKKRRVLVMDAGASSSSAFYATEGRYHPAVLGSCGVSYGISSVLAELGVEAIQRWLHFPMSTSELSNRLLNKQLRPHLLPSSPEDLAIDLALVREAMRMALTSLRDEIKPDDYDWLIGCGGVLTHAPHPGMALLALLDATQTDGEQQQPILDVHLDSLGLVPVIGGLAGFDSDAAITIFDRDLLSNTPLATCIIPLGSGKMGEVAVEVELNRVGGKSEQCTVRHGEVVRMALSPGRFAQLTLRPAAGVRIGSAAPGEVVVSDPAGITGSKLGVVIDARGRPIQLPSEDQQRWLKIWEWMVALGAESGANPYIEAGGEVATPRTESPAATIRLPAEVLEQPKAAPTSRPEPVVKEASPPAVAGEVLAGGEAKATAGKRISLSELAAQEQLKMPKLPPAPPEASGMGNELDALRQSVEAPKRRGWFGKKK